MFGAGNVATVVSSAYRDWPRSKKNHRRSRRRPSLILLGSMMFARELPMMPRISPQVPAACIDAMAVSPCMQVTSLQTG